MATTIDLNDKVAVVTGGANGIGEGAVMAIARSGGHAVIADKDAVNGERVAAAVAALGREVLFVLTDMLDADQIDAMVAKAAAQFGRIDILVNNVGGTRMQPFVEQNARSMRKVIDLNLMSMLLTTHAVAPIMIGGKRGGSIINVASTEALRAAPGVAVYAACKSGMVSFTKTMALELAPHNIRSHALAPDMIYTPGLAPMLGSAAPAWIDAQNRYVPLGRMGHIDDAGNLIAFLCSDLAAYLNGVTIPVDAGATAAAGWYRDPQNNWCLFHASE